MTTEQRTVELVEDDVVYNIVVSALMAALMGAVSWLAIPWVMGVEATLQLLVIFLAGIYLGPVWGGGSIVVYLLAGALGAPVFAGGSAGIGHFFGPTGGYLIAFPIGAVIVGAVVHRGLERRDPSTVSPLVLVGGMTLATAVIYALGVTQLSLVLELSPWEAVMAGAVPFIPWELLEMGMVLVIINAVNIAIE